MRVTFYPAEGVPFWRSYCFTHGIAPPDDQVKHRGATEHSLRILRPLGMDTDDLIPRLWISEDVKKRVNAILSREKLDSKKPWITINPYSRWTYKEWGDGKWTEILNWLWKEFGISSAIIGSAEERPRAEAFVRQCNADVINLAGLTTLAELAGVLSLSRLHIGVDSAAPHIAAATGIPTVTIYGPSSWFDWSPVGQDHRVIAPDMDCVPCHQKGCDNSGHSRCLEALNTLQVKSIIREMIESHEAAPS